MSIFKKSTASSASRPAPRTLEELEAADAAWPEIQALVHQQRVPVHLLPVEPAAGQAELLRLQITTRSYMGSIARYTGGMLVDGGWIRLLGAGSPGLPDMSTASGLVEEPENGVLVPAMEIGHDVLGGRFIVLGEGAAAGNVHYFAPDQLAWQDLEVGYGNFVGALLSDELDLEQFYESMRWHNWRAETAALRLDQGFSVYPFLFSKQAQPIDSTQRAVVPMTELFAFNEDAARRWVVES